MPDSRPACSSCRGVEWDKPANSTRDDHMKKALICGISGQDGGYLARLLLDKGYAVYGASRDAPYTAYPLSSNNRAR